MSINKINALEAKKRQPIFLIDGIGAMISALFLGFMAFIYNISKMPEQHLFLLVGIAGLLAIYSMTTYYLAPFNWKKYLSIIAIANSFYGGLTIFLLNKNMDSLSLIGKVYFIGELIIIAFLVAYEFKLLKFV